MIETEKVIEEGSATPPTQSGSSGSVKIRKRSKAFQKTSGRKVAEGIMFAILFLLCGSYLYILIWGVIMGCMTHTQTVISPFKFPEVWQFRNYIDAFTMLQVNNTNMVQMIGNSLWLTLGGAFLDVFCSLMMAYACAKFRFFGRNVLHGTSIVIMTLPIIGSGSAMYKLIYTLGLNDSIFYLVTYCSGFGMQYITLYGFMQNLSWSYAEAAYIDGASEAQVFFKIMIPMCISPICALLVLRVIGIWNDYGTSLLYLKQMPTLATGLYLFQNQMTYKVRMDILIAASMLSVMPILVMFLIFNKTLLDLDLGGGIKG